MNTNTFQVVITNQLKPDQDKNLVTQKLAVLFKTDEQKAAQLLIKPRTVIRDNLDEITARKYHAAILQTGASCEIINSEVADLPQIVEPPEVAMAPLPPRSPGQSVTTQMQEPELSLVRREEKVRKETQEKLSTLKNADTETLCPHCGTIRGSADALCLHCGYNPNEEASGKSAGRRKWIVAAAVMLAITVTALLAGLPYYQKIQAQKKLEQDFRLAFDVRNEVTAFIERTGFFPNQNMDADLPGNISNDAIESIVIGDNAVITVTLKPAAANNVSGQTVVFTPRTAQGRIVWNCMQGSLGNGLRPEICRK